MTLGQRLIVMNGGVVEQIGTPIELYSRPASVFVAGFIGSPAMNFVTARIADDGARVELPGGETLLSAEDLAGQGGRRVTLGIRPEHLSIAREGEGMVRLKVDLAEQLGADTLVHGRFGGDDTNFIVRLPGIGEVRSGELLPLAVKPEHLHLFAMDSGKRNSAGATVINAV